MAGPDFPQVAPLYGDPYSWATRLNDLPSILLARRRIAQEDARMREMERANQINEGLRKQQIEGDQGLRGRQITVSEGESARKAARDRVVQGHEDQTFAQKAALDRVAARDVVEARLAKKDIAGAGDVGETFSLGRPTKVAPPEAVNPTQLAAMVLSGKRPIPRSDLPPGYEGPPRPPPGALERGGLMIPGAFRREEETLPPGYEGPPEQRDLAAQPARAPSLKAGDLMQPGGLGLDRPSDPAAENAYKAALAAKAEAEAHPTYTATDPRGRVSRFDPTKPRTAELERETENADRWRASVESVMGADPVVMKAADFIHGELVSGSLKQLDAGKELNKIIALLYKPQTMDTPEEKMARTRVMAGPRWAGVRQMERAQDRADRVEPAQRAGTAQAQLTAYLAARGYKADIGEIKQAMDLAQMASSTNGAVNTALAGRFANLVQQHGVLTDRDYNQFWSRIGDIGERTEAWLSKALRGDFGPQRLADVKQATALLATNAGGHLRQTLEGATRFLTPIHGADVMAPLLGAVAFGDVAAPEVPALEPAGGPPAREVWRSSPPRGRPLPTPMGARKAVNRKAAIEEAKRLAGVGQ